MNESQADVELRAERDGLHHYPVAFLQHLIETGEVRAEEPRAH